MTFNNSVNLSHVGPQLCVNQRPLVVDLHPVLDKLIPINQPAIRHNTSWITDRDGHKRTRTMQRTPKMAFGERYSFAPRVAEPPSHVDPTDRPLL